MNPFKKDQIPHDIPTPIDPNSSPSEDISTLDSYATASAPKKSRPLSIPNTTKTIIESLDKERKVHSLPESSFSAFYEKDDPTFIVGSIIDKPPVPWPPSLVIPRDENHLFHYKKLKKKKKQNQRDDTDDTLAHIAHFILVSKRLTYRTTFTMTTLE
ncbi:uncharacterized protein B0P05DRAFT_642334 [Gilbertella persicaria]|uniref:uncharacterized protein n=1 Tax=Gilbertella persicaria TaxID=101096 RepID=UPI00221F7012|nr:uncharacterized protein B0P05DRAFT_642334 [Gilbertella persicaria]KAI8047406.1 hypothetical protein B0P05DRAFT_642334 [Gilbertella persicaria]